MPPPLSNQRGCRTASVSGSSGVGFEPTGFLDVLIALPRNNRPGGASELGYESRYPVPAGDARPRPADCSRDACRHFPRCPWLFRRRRGCDRGGLGKAGFGAGGVWGGRQALDNQIRSVSHRDTESTEIDQGSGWSSLCPPCLCVKSGSIRGSEVCGVEADGRAARSLPFRDGRSWAQSKTERRKAAR